MPPSGPTRLPLRLLLRRYGYFAAFAAFTSASLVTAPA